MALIGIANSHGNFGQRSPGPGQQILSRLHADASQVLHRCHPKKRTKLTIEMGEGQSNQIGHVRHPNGLSKVLFDVPGDEHQFMQVRRPFILMLDAIHRVCNSDHLASGAQQRALH